MTSTYNIPDYKSRFFEYEKLDKIHGQPDIDSIITLYRQCKLNEQTVRCPLGGAIRVSCPGD